MKYVLEVIFPCILFLYLIDCIVYIKKDHLLLVSHFGKHFKLSRPGLHLVGILPTAKTIILHNIPIYFTKKAIYILKDDSLTNYLVSEVNYYNSLEYDDISDIQTDGKDVKINGDKLIKTQSPIIARQIGRLIQVLKTSDSSERDGKIEIFLNEAMNLEEIRSKETVYYKYVFWLEILCIVLFVYCFVALPIVLYSDFYLVFNINILLLCIVVIYLSIISVSVFAERRVYQNRRRGSFTLISLILSPVSAIHAVSSLTKDIYAHFDYLAVAAELLPKKSFKALLGTELARISHLRDRAKKSDLKEYWLVKEKCLYTLLEEVGVTKEEVSAAPEKRDLSAKGYCPMCKTEYRSGFNSCSDCGVALERFKEE